MDKGRELIELGPDGLHCLASSHDCDSCSVWRFYQMHKDPPPGYTRCKMPLAVKAFKKQQKSNTVVQFGLFDQPVGGYTARRAVLAGKAVVDIRTGQTIAPSLNPMFSREMLKSKRFFVL